MESGLQKTSLLFIHQGAKRSDSGSLAYSLFYRKNQLEFRRHIALSLLQSDGSAPLRAVAVSVALTRHSDQRDVVKYAYETHRTCKKMQCSSSRRAVQAVLRHSL
ncbi:hypothetical protein T05_5311 [Trichinella murrelli]|uniref:Uncharacterized protein n=1 Tax=Trichinella murrelli TaxID=144512 RepID=A0A0V0TLZ5_9BILA|nr:hypothetical protein T05_5311 [Trichinella murrelli]